MLAYMDQEEIIHHGYGIMDMAMETCMVTEFTAGVLDMICIGLNHIIIIFIMAYSFLSGTTIWDGIAMDMGIMEVDGLGMVGMDMVCLLYTSPSPRD